MKPTLLLTIGSLLVISLSCSKELNYPNNINYLSATSETLTLTTSGNGKDESLARKDAIKRAMNALLFQGIPRSQWSKPLIKDKDKHGDFTNRFFSRDKYLDFIVNNSVTKSTKKGGVLLDLQTEINVVALRRYLESEGIIRGFGL